MNILLLEEYRRNPLKFWQKRGVREGVVQSKLDAFNSRRKQLEDYHGVSVRRRTCKLHQLPSIVRRCADDVIIYVADWRHDPDDFEDTLRQVRDGIRRPRFWIYDTFDQTSSPFLSCLPYVDVYLKSQTYSSLSEYTVEFSSGYKFADWFSKRFNFDLRGWRFGSTTSVELCEKIHAGWNLGVASHFMHLAKASHDRSKKWIDRSIEINIRFGLPSQSVTKWEWYHEYRQYCINELQKLAHIVRCSGSGRLPFPEYFSELENSRMTFSPFGWGEICFRDFEAIAAGSLLIKPDMSHLNTRPNLFRDRETCLFVEWDLSNLPEIVDWALANPRQCEHIASEAQRELMTYLPSGRFENGLREILQSTF